MDAVLSGHAGVALLLEGDRLSSIHFEDSSEVLPRTADEIHLLFAGAQDLQFLENVGLEEVRSELDLAGIRVDALHLALNLLDAELSHGTRRRTAEDLEELLEDERIVRWVENVLFAHPLPRSADPVGARSACTGRTERTRALLGKLESFQPVIVEVQQAWEAIPARLFATDEDRKHALSLVVKEGLFRDLVARRAAGERIDDFLLRGLTNPALKQIRDVRHVLMEWVADFREPRMAPLPLEREISYVAEDTQLETDEPGHEQSVRYQVTWRERALSRALGEGDLDKARHETLQAQSRRTIAPIYPDVRVSVRSRSRFALVSAIRYGLRRAGIPPSEIERFNQEALSVRDPARFEEICKKWVLLDPPKDQ